MDSKRINRNSKEHITEGIFSDKTDCCKPIYHVNNFLHFVFMKAKNASVYETYRSWVGGQETLEAFTGRRMHPTII